MSRRSTIGLGAAAGCFWRVARHPWIGSKLVGLQLDKWFFNHLHPAVADGQGGRIRQLSLRITDLCHLRCRTCGQWGEAGFLHDKDLAELKRQEVSPQRYVEVMEDLVAHGHRPLVYLWGGEPMLYAGSLEVIEAAARLGLPASVATNGIRVAAAAERLVQAPLFLFQISIDGPSAELHNAIRPAVGGADNFAEISAALEAIRGARGGNRTGLPLVASLTVISEQNAAHLADIYDVFRDRVDLFVFYLSWWIDEARAREHEQDFERRFGCEPACHRGWIGRWKPADYESLDSELQRVVALSRSRGAPPVVMIPRVLGADALRAYYCDHANRFGYDQCISIFQAVEINSNGDMSPCRDYHDYVVGNIKDSTITELWNSERYREFRRSISRDGLMPVCSRCCGLMGY